MSILDRGPALRDERGFTLMELLVTMVAAFIVFSATLTMLTAATNQSQASIDRVDATQRGRTAIEQMLQELHSSCVWATAPAVMAGSTTSSLKILSQLTPSATPIPYLHVDALSGTNLVDTAYPLTNQSDTNPADWTSSAFSTTAITTKTLSSNVSSLSFGYYQYVGGVLGTDAAHQLATPLTATDAPNVAEITVSLAVAPSSGSTQADRTINLNDAAVLLPPPNVTTSDNTPQCP